jgi:D-tagatose-1,6-bisphosphate aldolase subunit GatZ/KbaZ
MELAEITVAQKRGEARGITSICSANPWVLKAAMQRAAQNGTTLLIESTCNQVNQFGGYTGLTPADFAVYLSKMARENGLAKRQLLLGGDHLGPSVWQNEPEASAMEKSAGLVQACVLAGYTKLHLDTTPGLDLDPSSPAYDLNVETVARRAAFLARVAEETCSAHGLASPYYVIGTEVPVPGGATVHENGVAVTTAQDVRRTIEVTRSAFLREGLDAAWERVTAVVVQPGVEFGDDFVLDYRPEKARELAGLIEAEPHLVYEAHSTDYQTREALRKLVCDHFAILKVGPGLTFALREAFFALALMENELFPKSARSNLIAVLDAAMRRDPRHWQRYYPGTRREQAFKRKFSLSDRLRYYWPDEQVQAALAKLMGNLSQTALPLSLVSQYAPWFYEQLRRAEIPENLSMPEALLLARVSAVLADYEYACGN